MKIKSIDKLKIPKNLLKILYEKEYWEDYSFEPILITIEEIQYHGEDMISYQAEFEVLDEYEDIQGDEWEELIRIYIKEKEPKFVSKIEGDSEMATCVLLTNNESDFRRMLGYIIELLEDNKTVNRIYKTK